MRRLIGSYPFSLFFVPLTLALSQNGRGNSLPLNGGRVGMGANRSDVWIF